MQASRDPMRDPNHQLVVSFLTTGRVIGYLGLFLPASLLAWSLTFGDSIRGSVSEYYYTPVRDLFVGTLTAMAIFLWSYRGYSLQGQDLRLDWFVGKFAAVMALLTAFSPLIPRNDDRCTLVQCVLGTRVADQIHAIAATAFIVCLLVFCVYLMPRNDVPGPRLRARAILYRSCGAIIALTVIGMVTWKSLPAELIFALGGYRPIFWLEAFAIWAFSLAWLVRGHALRHHIMLGNGARRDDAIAAPPELSRAAGIA